MSAGVSPKPGHTAVPSEQATSTEKGKALPASTRTRRPVRQRPTPWRRALKRDWRLYTFLILPLAYLLVFQYIPMAGNIIAFRRFRPGGSIFGEQWVGLHYIEMFITNPTFWNVFTNTLILGVLSLIIVFPLPIILALLLNE